MAALEALSGSETPLIQKVLEIFIWGIIQEASKIIGWWEKINEYFLTGTGPSEHLNAATLLSSCVS